MAQGLISLIPIAVTIGTVLMTKKTFSSILCGIIAGFILIGGGSLYESLNLLIDGLYKAMADADMIWIILVVVLFGGWAALMEGSGVVLGVSKAIERIVKTRKTALLGIWILGMLFFFDEYLNVFAVSAIMKRITDKFKISREMLAFIINSTGVTICVIVPFSSWSVFMLGLMEKADMTQGLSPIAAYMQTIPYIVYGWFTVLTVPLFAVGVLPLFGSMKKSESRALETGQVLSEISLKPPTEYIPQKLMKSGEYFALLIKGMVNMFPVVAIIVLAYTFRIINKELGLADFIINIILNYIPGVFLPVTIFVVMAFLSFATGTFWVLAAITFPIVECLAAVIGVNPFLCAGALISAVAFGGHICMYSDTVLLTSAFTKVTNYDYLKTSFPLVMVPFSLSAILYVILGFMIA
jgi:Na+/H+ antiporter NhaC